MPTENPNDKPTTVPLSIRFSAGELEQLRQEAARAGVPVSTLIRKSALARPDPLASLRITASNAPSAVQADMEPSVGVQTVGYRGGYSTRVS